MSGQDRSKFLDVVMRNDINRTIMDRLPEIALPDWYLVAGCLYQTVWNDLSGHSPEYGISDYDVFYCDESATTWEAEDRIIKQCAEVFLDLKVDVQVRNQARVHLWYEEKYGASCPPLLSSRDGIDGFLNQSSCYGIRRDAAGGLEVYAPFGYTDLFDMTLRPNLRRNVPDVYYEKARRWCGLWPNLKVVPWSDEGDTSRLSKERPMA